MSDDQKALSALVDHLGKTHLVIVVLCLAIIATHLFDRNEAALRARATVDKLASASEKWDQGILDNAAKERSRVVWARRSGYKPGHLDIVTLPIRVNGVEKVVRLKLLRDQYVFLAKQTDAVTTDPSNLSCEFTSGPLAVSGSTLSLQRPTCVRDIRYMWDSLDVVNEILVGDSVCVDVSCISIEVEPKSAKVELIRTPLFRELSDAGEVPWLAYLELRPRPGDGSKHVVQAYVSSIPLAEQGLAELSSMKVTIDYTVVPVPFSVRETLGPVLGAASTDVFSRAFPDFDQYTKRFGRISFAEARLIIADDVDRSTQAFDFLGVKVPAQLLGRLASFMLFSLQLYLYLQLRELSRRLPPGSQYSMMSWIALYGDSAARTAAVTSIVVAPFLAASIFWARGVLAVLDAVLLSLSAVLALLIANALWHFWGRQGQQADAGASAPARADQGPPQT